jgi:hypothetical protein
MKKKRKSNEINVGLTSAKTLSLDVWLHWLTRRERKREREIAM